MRILVADDEPNVRKVIARTLRQLGHEVVGEAEDGTALLLSIAGCRPDLVTLDLDMPGPDAFRVARTLCHEHRVAVVVVSGRAEMESAHDLAVHGIGAVVRKPFTAHDLA